MTTLVFTEKLGVLPDRIFEAMFNDRLVAKGTMLQVITEVFKFYISLMDGSVDELVALLAKAKVSDRLLLYFPPGQQTEEAFKAHFEKEGMQPLVRSALPRVPPLAICAHLCGLFCAKMLVRCMIALGLRALAPRRTGDVRRCVATKGFDESPRTAVS